MPMPEPSPTAPRQRALVRLALGPDVAIGLSAALGLLLISGAVHLFFGAFAAAAASVGAIVVTPPDQPAARRGKFWQLLPAALVGTPLFFAVQWLHADPLALAALVVPASFVAFLGAAWGKRGLPVSIAVMFAMVFSMAVPAAPGAGHALATTGWFALGAAAYLFHATLANALLNARYRRLVLADALFAMARLMRSQARQFAADVTAGSAGPNRWIGLLLQQQAALADQLQATRNIVLESPRTPQRQRRAAMLLQLLDLRDHLLACELDLDTLRASPGQHPVLTALRRELERLAEDVDALADALQRDRPPPPHADRRAAAPVIATDAPPAAPGTGTDPGTMTPSAARLATALVDRVGHIHDEFGRLGALARGETLPDQAVVHAHWRLFISPTTWSWRPFLGLWRWDAPPLRHAIRAALAIAIGEAVAMALPWGTHDYWILLTIVVVLRGSLAQTLERRNSRVAGTLLGCLIAGALLAAHSPAFLLLFVVTAAQGVAHAFAIRRYLVTAVAATVLALLQAHLLGAGGSLAFEVAERLADTLIGTAIAWAFSYVLPSWERGQLPALVARTLAAQAQHAQVALGLGQLVAVDDEAEWDPLESTCRHASLSIL